MPYPSSGKNIEKNLTDVQKFQGLPQYSAEIKETRKFSKYLHVKRVCKLTSFCVINQKIINMRVKKYTLQNFETIEKVKFLIFNSVLSNYTSV